MHTVLEIWECLLAGATLSSPYPRSPVRLQQRGPESSCLDCLAEGRTSQGTWDLVRNEDSWGHPRPAESATLGEVGTSHLSLNKPPGDSHVHSSWRRSVLGKSPQPILPGDPAVWPQNVTNLENVLSISPLVCFSSHLSISVYSHSICHCP